MTHVPQQRRFGRLVVEAGLASAEQVEACVREVQVARARGEVTTLGQVMLRRGILTRQEILRVLRNQNKTVLQCMDCGRRYNIVDYRPEERYSCRHDSGRLKPRLDDVDASDEDAEERLPAGDQPVSRRGDPTEAEESSSTPTPTTNRMPVRLDSSDSSVNLGAFLAGDSVEPLRTARSSTGSVVPPHAAEREHDTLAAAEASTPDDAAARTAPFPYPDDAIGHIGDYLLTQLLGRGGMGDVYLGRNPMLEGHFAIKVLNEEKARNIQYRERFLREARLANRLDHPNVVKVWDVGEIEGYYFIVMEYIEGETLAERVKRTGEPLPVHEAVSVVIQAMRGIEAAHAAGIIHRDLKPGNIIIREDGLVKVFDFGLALPISPGEKKLTLQGQTFGTPHYMSPEQVFNRPVDHRTDIFSMGVTLYHALTAGYPYPGEKAMEVMVKRINEAPLPIENYRTDLPFELVRLINVMMADSPYQRFDDAYAARKALEPFALQAGPAASS